MCYVGFVQLGHHAAQASSHDQHSSLPSSIQHIADEFQAMSDPKQRYKLLLKYAKQLPVLDASNKVATNRVMGCTSEVWMTASLDDKNKVQFAGDSDSELTRGLCAVLVQGMSGLTPGEVLQVCCRSTWLCHDHLSHFITSCSIS